MEWTKPSTELVQKFDDAIASYALAERRLMFGMPAVFLNGNMFAGLHGERMFLRLPHAPRAELEAKEGGGPFEVMPGRAMSGYAIVPPSILGDAAELDDWLGKAFEHAQTLPPKVKKPRTAKAKK
jgi:TfoX/Sxy family transcriptional regulator of competence genes